jgi:hypothetical protein
VEPPKEEKLIKRLEDIDINISYFQESLINQYKSILDLLNKTYNININNIITKTLNYFPIPNNIKFNEGEIKRSKITSNLSINYVYNETIPQLTNKTMNNNRNLMNKIDDKITQISKKITDNFQIITKNTEQYKILINSIITSNLLISSTVKPNIGKQKILKCLQIVDNVIDILYNKIIETNAKYVMFVDLENLSLLNIGLNEGTGTAKTHINKHRFKILEEQTKNSTTVINKDKIFNIIISTICQLYNTEQNKIFVVFIANDRLTYNNFEPCEIKIFADLNYNGCFDSCVITSGKQGDDSDDLIIAFLTETINFINKFHKNNIKKFLIYSNDNYIWWFDNFIKRTYIEDNNVYHCELTDEYQFIYRPTLSRCDLYSLPITNVLNDELFDTTTCSEILSKLATVSTVILNGGYKKKLMIKTKKKQINKK